LALDSDHHQPSGPWAQSHLRAFIHVLAQLIPDAEHALVTAYVDVTFTLSGFYQMVISKTPRPSYTYEIIKSNTTASIKVQVDTANPYVPPRPLPNCRCDTLIVVVASH
jgi:hypothetical protein